MKIKYLLLVISLAITNISYSQEIVEAIKIDLPCYNTTQLFKSLREKYKELPIVTGTASDEAESTVSIWMDPIEKNWTIVTTKKELSCIVGLGTDIKLLSYKRGNSI
jgi:hypothetical protein